MAESEVRKKKMAAMQPEAEGKVESAMKEATATEAQLEADVKQAQADSGEAKKAVAEKMRAAASSESQP